MSATPKVARDMVLKIIGELVALEVSVGTLNEKRAAKLAGEYAHNLLLTIDIETKRRDKTVT